MDTEYSVEVCKTLEEEFNAAALHRPMAVVRYEAGDRLSYDLTEVASGNRGRIRLIIEGFVGGGFAGQVYRVRAIDIEPETAPIEGLEEDGVYAMKILIPPTPFSRLFRNAVYWLAFQGPFQLQVNPSAAMSGAIWQKFIRRAAKIRFGDERAVADIHAIIVDHSLGSCGELSEWIEGRTWRLEVDERLDLLKRWRKGKDVDPESLGSPEYRAKREFMARFVALLHEIGAHEFARQYEWSTCKSQPNCLKREETEGSPSEGLVAVDFRAGLALLPFLPMSPGDFKLIAKGFTRGSLVQFDLGDIGRLERFVAAHTDRFSDMGRMLSTLKTADGLYRDSLPDITHHHVRLLYSPRLWTSIFESAVTGWKVRNLIDEGWEEKLRRSKALTLLFFLIGIIPLLGRLLRRIWGQPYWRRHYRAMLGSRDYLWRAIRAKLIEKIPGWHRAGRVEGERALRLAQQVWRCLYHLPLAVLPAGLHRFATDWRYARDRLDYLLLRPVRLYFDADLREQWLRDMVEEGREKHLLSEEDATVILSQVKEAFIQKYLKSLAVHLCTLPVTQVVSFAVAVIYVLTHPEMPRGQAYGIGLGIIALFQVTPISPGSLVRGFYVLYLVIRERNFKDYNVAVFLGFFKYIGYLAFPIQMAYRYPALARFMAGHWATEAVHVVPVFGERGALLEHGVFCLFYNWPLTLRRRMQNRGRMRAKIRPRYWHIALCAVAGSALFGVADLAHLYGTAELPGLRDIWWLAAALPLLCGSVVTLGAGGAPLWKRIVGAVACGGAVGILSSAVSWIFGPAGSVEIGGMATTCVWRVFVFAIFSTLGALLTEAGLPDPGTDV
jgi:hypothetical protein